MPYCCVISCKNHSKKTNQLNSGLTYHSFPIEEKIRRKWIEAIGLSADWVPQKNSSVCSKHFSDKDVFLTGDGKVICRLAVPSLHLNDSDVESDDDDVPLDLQRSALTAEKQKSALKEAEMTIKDQKLTIKKLQDSKRRNEKKIALQTRVIEDLMEVYELKKEDITVLKEYILLKNTKLFEETDY